MATSPPSPLRGTPITAADLDADFFRKLRESTSVGTKAPRKRKTPPTTKKMASLSSSSKGAPARASTDMLLSVSNDHSGDRKRYYRNNRVIEELAAVTEGAPPEELMLRAARYAIHVIMEKYAHKRKTKNEDIRQQMVIRPTGVRMANDEHDEERPAAWLVVTAAYLGAGQMLVSRKWLKQCAIPAWQPAALVALLGTDKYSLSKL